MRELKGTKYNEVLNIFESCKLVDGTNFIFQGNNILFFISFCTRAMQINQLKNYF